MTKQLLINLLKFFAFFIFIILLILIVEPLSIIDMKQAQRIAKWKSEFEQLNYCFSLVETNEGAIIPSAYEIGRLVTDEDIIERFRPYFQFVDMKPKELKKYKYKKMNGRRLHKNSIFNFDKFIGLKDGSIIAIKENSGEIARKNLPLGYMFVDVNGIEKPNIIGQDIFFINIYRHGITALGYDRAHSSLKANCSPVGSGLYCSQYYLLGGHF